MNDPHEIHSPHTETVPAAKHSMVYTSLKHESVSGNCMLCNRMNVSCAVRPKKIKLKKNEKGKNPEELVNDLFSESFPCLSNSTVHSLQLIYYIIVKIDYCICLR